MPYYPRVVDPPIAQRLRVVGGVVIEGARACGRTATGSHHAASAVRLDASPAAVELADLDPKGLLGGRTPRLIDEWQFAPSLWNVIRHEIDDRRAPGQFLLCGSATPPNLIRLRDDRVDLARLGEPAFLAVVTGTEAGYTLPSGVHVLPLGCLTA